MLLLDEVGSRRPIFLENSFKYNQRRKLGQISTDARRYEWLGVLVHIFEKQEYASETADANNHG